LNTLLGYISKRTVPLEKLYEFLVNNSNEGVALVNPEGKIDFCNPAFSKITGYGREEVTDTRIENLTKILHIKHGILNKISNAPKKIKITVKYGNEKTVEFSHFIPENTAEGYSVIYLKDITNCAEFQEESKTLYRSLFESASDAIFLMKNNKFIDCNKKTLKIFLVSSKSEINGHTPWEFSPPKQPDGLSSIKEARKRIQAALDGRPQRFYWQHRKTDGRVFDTEVSLNNIKGHQGYIFAIVRDITFSKQTEQQLKKSYIAMEQSPVSIVITDLDGNIEYINPKFSEITGYSFEEIKGQNPRILKSGETSDEEYKELWNTITKGGIWRGEFHNLKKNGELYWESAIIAPVKDRNGKITNFIGVKEDITELKRLQNQLSMAQKMESIGNLTGGIAHDFNNILTAINGYAEIILADLNSDDPLYEEVHAIQESGNKAAELVSKLLAFSRRQIIKPRILDINTVINDLLPILPRMIGEDIEIKKELSETVSTIKADQSQIDQILINLLVNARDALNSKSDRNAKKFISFKTENIAINNDYVTNHPGSYKGNFVIFSVSDNGKGMPEDIRRRVFEPFFTTKEIGHGTGMGLSTVYGIVKQNRGFIYVYSEPDKGSVFKIYWPASELSAIHSEKENRNLSVGGKATILLVEDNETVLNFAKKALTELGYTIITAKNGKEAIALINKDTKHFDLIISDIVMPEMGGIELAENVRRYKKDIKFIFTSGYTNNELGNIDLIQKPYSISELSQKIKKVIGEL